EQNNLFLTSLEERREWYRYHSIFAQFLRRGLAREQQTALQRKAVDWFASQALLPEAIHYALAAGDERAATLIARAARSSLLNGEHATLRRWLAALPEKVVAANGELSTYRGWLLFQSGQIEEALRAAGLAETVLALDPPSLPYGRLRCLQAWLALHRQEAQVVIGLAREAADLVAEEDDAFHVLALTALGEGHEALGDTATAVQVYRQAVVASRKLARPVAALLALVHLAIALNENGRRKEAVALCRQALEADDEASSKRAPTAGAIYLVRAYLSYDANQLEQARSQLGQGLDAWRQLGVQGALLFGRRLLAEVQRAAGNLERAEQTARAVRLQAHGHQSANYVSWADAFLQDMRLQQGDLTAVARWGDESGFSPSDRPHPWQWPAYVTYARLLLAQERPDEALALLSTLEESARRGGRIRALITIRLLQALAYAAQRREAQSLARLQGALELAAGEDYARPFLDEGQSLFTLLRRLHQSTAEDPLKSFIERLLPEQNGRTISPVIATDALVEPLTERELEVLQLIAAGRSNPEIAEALVVSLNTVKWHVKNIYGKLQASNRVEAATRAREYNLL
ncbi:MAG TPA: LuxR C-terminal-related transcriptional regulator, partial [Candidatus Sulfomarinibacteraceae bacterium]|nr:LuxR C-terminal-related transcriptional regulator [Candidatus Sulfomarinibacteraceae bacterium]